VVDQQSATCFDCHAVIFKLCFFYKGVNAVDLYIHVGVEISLCT
jgi:hypothetical protein